MLALSLFALLFASAFYGWRYSKTSVDPDWAYFNLYAFTGSLYGRDFADCKTPGVHLWYWLLSQVCGKDVTRIKFANHFLVSLPSILILFQLGFWQALAYIVLVNSGWLLAFHGNVGQVPAALIVLGLLIPFPFSLLLWLTAVFYEPKLILPLILSVCLYHWEWSLAVAAVIAVFVFVFRTQEWMQWMWESSFEIPKRIGLSRTAEFSAFLMPWFTSNGFLYLLPWILFSFGTKPFSFWLAPLAYFLFLIPGKVIRQNHLIPVVAWVALAVPEHVAMILITVDLISSGLLFGDIWRRFYSSLADMNDEAKKVGEYLKDKPGIVYVNGIHSGIYLYSGKPIPYGLAQQIEIREVAKERREGLLNGWRKSPPDWVVVGELPGIKFVPHGYSKIVSIGQNTIYRKGV